MLSCRTASIVPALALCLLSACGDDPPDTPEPSPPPAGETITGRERIGWTQQAGDTVELATFGYVVYVDGTRVVLGGVACGTTRGAGGFDCSAPLPPLAPGGHVLELASFTTSGSTVLESARATPLRVNVVPVTVSAQEVDALDGASVTTSDGVRLRAEVIARGLDDPTDLAVLPDGRLLVAERAGLVRVVDPTRTTVEGAGHVRDAVELVAMTIDPEFARTQRVYLLHTARTEHAASLRLVRATELNGSLGQAAVVFEQPIARAEVSAVARFGPDGMLYVAAGGDILRLTANGTTPRDNPAASPVISSGHRWPRALAWQPDTGALWEVERRGLHDVAAGADYGWLIPADATLGGAVFHRGEAVFRGDLFVASPGAKELFRVPFSKGRPVDRAQRTLSGRFGRIGQVIQAPDAALYFTTANRDTWGPGRDLIVRLSQQSAISNPR